MSSDLPPQFINLRTAFEKPNGLFVNIMGVVTDFMSVSRTRGTDWTCKFSLADATFGNLGHLGDEGLSVRCFNAISTELPQIQGKGDVVILRGAKTSFYQGIKGIISSHGMGWTVIPSASIPTSGPSSTQPLQLAHKINKGSTPPSRLEMLYAIILCNMNDREAYGTTSIEGSNVNSAATAVPEPTHQGKGGFALVRDLNINTYYDLVGQVAKIYPTSDRVELYFTDYTGNQILREYIDEDSELDREGDEYGYLHQHKRSKQAWPGPYGKHTLTITLWSPHSFFAQSHIQQDDFVSIRNVHIKFSNAGKMEGVLHTDRRNPDKIDVSVLKDYEDDDKVKDVLRRKRDYWKIYNNKHKKLVTKSDDVSKPDDDKPSLKRKADEDEKHLTKREKKRLRRQQQAIAAKAKASNRNVNDGQSDGPTTKPNGILPINPSLNLDLNPNTRCAFPNQPTRPISAIKSQISNTNTSPAGVTYTLPFQNINSRATVRIIDFWPPDLEDFTIRERKSQSEYAILSDASSTSSSSNSDHHDSVTDSNDSAVNGEPKCKWLWAFKLLLEDATPKRKRSGNSDPEEERLWVTVADRDAEYLLQLDADDLHKGSQALAALREKLFFLWGDLEERKRARRGKEGEDVEMLDTGGNEDGRAQGRENGISAASEEANSPVSQCCLKEYGVKIRKKRPPETDGSKMDVDSVGEPDNDGERGFEKEWIFERRWRLFGCTIV